MNFDGNGREVIERTVLGCLVAHYDTYKDYIAQLSKEEFLVFPRAFELIRICYDEGATSTVPILEKFADDGMLSFIMDCAVNVVTVFEFQPALKRLRELNISKRLEEGVSNLLMQKSLNVQSLRQLLEDAQSRAVSQSDEETCMKNVDKYLEELGKPRDIIKTGFPIVDKTLSGLRKKTVCYIGARPSTGKTSFAINIAQAQKEKRVLFFSLEMTASMIYDRYTSALVNMPYEKFTANRFDEKELQVIRAVVQGIKEEKRLFVIDDVFGIEAMESAVMNIRPDIVIIDYIQKITSTKKFFNARESMEYISGELKKLAKFANCAVICLSQLSRNGTEEPRMSDLKESGALEADGDYIFLLHRPFVLSKDEDVDPTETKLLIDKNKFGNTGLVRMHFDGEFQRFSELSAPSKDERL